MWCHRCVAGLGPTPVGKVCGCWCWQGHYLCPLCGLGFLPARRLGSRSDCLKRLQVETALPCKSCGLPSQPQAQPGAQGGVQNAPLEGRRVSITPGERVAGLHSAAPFQARPGAALQEGRSVLCIRATGPPGMDGVPPAAAEHWLLHQVCAALSECGWPSFSSPPRLCLPWAP